MTVKAVLRKANPKGWTVRHHLIAWLITLALVAMGTRVLDYIETEQAYENCNAQGGYLVRAYGGDGWLCTPLEVIHVDS